MHLKKILFIMAASTSIQYAFAFERGGMGGGDDMGFRRDDMNNDSGRSMYFGRHQQDYNNANNQDAQTSNSRTINTQNGKYQVNDTVTHQNNNQEQINTNVTNQRTGQSYSAQTQYNHIGNEETEKSTITNNKTGNTYTTNATHLQSNGKNYNKVTATNNQTGQTYSTSNYGNNYNNQHQYYYNGQAQPYYSQPYYGGYAYAYPTYVVDVPIVGVGYDYGYTPPPYGYYAPPTSNVTNNYYSTNTYQNQPTNNHIPESYPQESKGVPIHYYY